MLLGLMSGEELERSEAHRDGGDGVRGSGTTGSANVTHDSDGGPDDSGEGQKSPLGLDESSNTGKDCNSDTPLCGADWQGEEMTLRLRPSSPENGYKRSPTRGMLRAVSSITITDIEAFEEGLSTLRSNIPHAPLVHTITHTKKLSPVPAENTSTWSPSYKGTTNQKPRRGVGKSRRRREQRGEAWYSDDDILDEMGSPERPPFVGEDTVSMASLIRRKSIDILPNVPKRAPSTQDLHDSGGKGSHKTRTSSDEDSEMKRLMHTLHNELYVPGPKTPKTPKQNPLDNNSTNSNATFRGTSPLDMFTTFPPRRHVGGELAVDRFDRFNSDIDPFTNLLPRHHSLDGMLFPVNGTPPRTSLGGVEGVVGVHTSKVTGDDESESEPESHFKVREFVVSLDYLEDNKTRGDMPRRRRSFDALPTPPRRFLDDLEAEDGDETSVRRRSFDDLGNVRRRPLESGLNQDYGDCLDQSHRSQQRNIREGGSAILDASHRSQLGLPLDQSTRSQPAYNPVDRSHRSQSNGSAEMNDVDLSMRRTSHDMLPALPRRRLASESSSSDSELSPLPLRMDDALVQRKAADFVPNAPRRTDSGIGSKASSLSFSDFHLDEMTNSSTSSAVKDPPVPSQKTNSSTSSAVKDPPVASEKTSLVPLKNSSPSNLNNHNSGPLRLKSYDQIPSLPTRDRSLTAFDLFEVSSEDHGNHADTEDNGGSHQEHDYESIDDNTSDRSLLVSIKDPLGPSSATRYHGNNGRMNRTLVEPTIIEGGASEELSPTTSTGNPSDVNDDEEEDGDDEGDYEDHDDEDDTETSSLDHPEGKEAETSLKRNRVSRRRKKKSSFLVRLFASRN